MGMSEEACLNYFLGLGGSHYERERGIKTIDYKKVLQERGISAYTFSLTDGSMKIVLFYNRVKNGEDWVFWVPSEAQMNGMESFVSLYKRVNILNSIQVEVRHDVRLSKSDVKEGDGRC